MNHDIRAIAFYLPQYHPVPENDTWWGNGFTEWRNVAKARPLFPGHYQPHQPADLGYYDLRLPDVRESQAALARAHGIHGFCYYHYWFAGRRILERPFNEVLSSGKPDFPFCLCWANENWTRAWDGGDREVLLGQKYCNEDDRAHIKALIPALLNPRYIRIDNRPLLLIYRTELLPDPLRTATIWREEAIRAGVGEIYLARVEGFTAGIDPRSIGFDAAVEFAPDWRTMKNVLFRTRLFRKAIRYGLLPDIYLKQSFARYDELISRMQAKPRPDYVQFRCVTPGFDNTSRRESSGAAVYVGSTPEKYGHWLEETVRRTALERTGDERVVFLNAWNEWAEGNHLEPDMKYGHAYLEATRRALEAGNVSDSAGVAESELAPINSTQRNLLTRRYWKLRAQLKVYGELFEHIRFWRCRSRHMK